MIIHRGKQPVYFTHSQHQLTFSLDGSKIIGFRILFIRFFSPLTPTLKRRVFFPVLLPLTLRPFIRWLLVGCWKFRFFSCVSFHFFSTRSRQCLSLFRVLRFFFFLILIHSSHSAPGNYCALPLLDIRFLKHSTI